MIKKNIILIFLIFGISTINFAQLYYSVGYTAGKFTTGLPNIRNTIYQYNNIDFPNLDNKFNYTNLPHGVCFEIGLHSSKYYYFFRWSNMHINTRGKGLNPTSPSENLDIKIKVRFNQLSPFNFGLMLNKKIGIAYSPIDLANFKVLYKSNVNYNNNNKYKANTWLDFYDVTKGMLSSYFTAGTTLYLDYFATKNIHFRLIYYNDWFGENLGVQPQYRYRANNVSINLTYRFNKK